LFLVVGPSGSGKDTLIAAAEAEFAAGGRYLFARRVVTRPADAGGEAHEAVSADEFSALSAERAFALEWSAHGLRYGIRAEIAEALAAGRHVVANVSRTIVQEARARFAPLAVVWVSAAPAVLAQRLAARRREDPADIALRLARGGALPPEGDIRAVDNSGELGPAVAAFLAALRA
jgi:phosphonate metabolism protein PhnN/1,5-bisphosphokinase (PRPP-forming)